ncbi:Ubiquitin-conjugating enzyme E2 [Lachnellula subtilissima]|uniref:Ubiquitin-conjugating enzyme E2 n=1 Tax=Lachnellula subtilissima TaxID=602034 RepID=A0A8H8U7L8_9HELO|nr:Ubiquitin-conjugating enzyme E2 [Lachnellula subtilissima]
MSNHSIIRITKELADLQKCSDLSLAVACRDVDVRNVKAIIIGPPDTPYEFGFFEVRETRWYTTKRANVPSVPGEIWTRYENIPRRRRVGTKVVLQNIQERLHQSLRQRQMEADAGSIQTSMLLENTWRGERGEEWSSAQGLESILISIQSLMSSNPYENEPGFETALDESAKKDQKDYVAKIRHESLRISVIQRLEEYLGISPAGAVAPHASIDDYEEDEQDIEYDDSSINFDPFRDLCKRRFLWYYDSYLLAISKAKTEVKDGQAFSRMPFECTGNTMEGKFNYTELERRLRLIKKTLDAETARWAEEGLVLLKKESTAAANLQRQYEQVVEAYKRDKKVTLDIELVDNNPFVWSITYIGRPMTNLDGGLFRITLCFSPRFPEEQPRAKFETPLFHHRIALDGTPCYSTKRAEDAKSHLQAIIEALEEVSPPYDPRTLVNPDAAKLFWGSEDDKKMYNRKLRRAVQRTTE